jgi:transmembrane sensor
MKPASAVKHDPLEWIQATGKSAAVLSEIKTVLRQRRRKRVRKITAASGLALVFLVWFGLVPYLRQTSSVEVPSGRRLTVALVDGSSAELNTQTEIRTDFRYGRRRVRLLRGEAFFSVAPDSSHPFVVETPGGSVRVLGTRFNVRLDADDRIEVVLVEGSVALDDVSREPVTLRPGQEFTITKEGPSVRNLTPSDLDRFTAWRTGRIVLEGLTLKEAADRFAAFHGRRIAVAPALAGARMGGVASLDDLNEFLANVQDALPAKVDTLSDGTVRIGPK